MSELSSPVTIYIHVPFCIKKCPYCDFYSLPTSTMSKAEINEYGILLVKEFRLFRKKFPNLLKRNLISIYFGGGTPTIADPECYSALLTEIRKTWDFSDDVEITVEANPETLDEKKLNGFTDLGINRISVGIQSFSQSTLFELGRVHNVQKSMDVISMIKNNSKIKSYSIDIMFGLHNQTFGLWEETLETALSIYPPHISVYGLTIHAETDYYDRMKRGELNLPDEEIQIKMFKHTHELLVEAGYDHYEISNYAHPGHRSIHNLNYWKGNEYIGLGAGAHSFIEDVHYFSPDNFAIYRNHILTGNLAYLKDPYSSKEALIKEKIMLYIRLLEGIDIQEFNIKYDCNLLKDFKKQINTLLHLGLIDIFKGRLFLTEDGLLLADEVTSYFF